MKKTGIKYVGLLSFLFLSSAVAQAQINIGNKVTLSGSLQSDILFPEEDEAIGTGEFSEKVLTNTYLDLNLRSKYVNAGARLEYLDYPLPGFEKDFAGWGVPYFYVQGKYKNVELTVGDFYEQFGNGFIFRTYEERSLGIDNSLRGGRLVFQPFRGINVKMLGGKQRRYWEHNDSYIWGADAEFHIEQWSKKLEESNTYLTFGASYVGKQEDDEIVEGSQPKTRLNLPKVVNAMDFRAQLQKGNYNVMVDYAVKGCDPSSDNYYIYKPGNAFMISASYSKRGISALIQAKRSDNMSYRSLRTFSGVTTSSYINNLPVFAYQHTYSLATLYPYSTQTAGEWAFQGEFGYNFKRRTFLGGKYGTNVKINFSHIRSIYGTFTDTGGLKGTDGKKKDFFDLGDDLYYQDANISIDKKLSKSFKLNLMYIHQIYDPTSNGHFNEKKVKSNIIIAEGKYQINKKLTLRAELQYLKANAFELKENTENSGEGNGANGNMENGTTNGTENTKVDIDPLERSNQGDWLFGLIELSIAPSFMFSVSDMYNIGATDLHYYNISGVYTYKSHRLMLGYGRTRKGYTCAGGVCREVPASKGFTISYSYNF